VREVSALMVARDLVLVSQRVCLEYEEVFVLLFVQSFVQIVFRSVLRPPILKRTAPFLDIVI
jgi:hypothetical protein